MVGLAQQGTLNLTDKLVEPPANMKMYPDLKVGAAIVKHQRMVHPNKHSKMKLKPPASESDTGLVKSGSRVRFLAGIENNPTPTTR